jgi:type II secretory pathway pseudopilin PulG
MRPRRKTRGFTLVQIVMVIAIISVLAALTVGFFGRGRAEARRAQCDVRLKALALALDAFRQENGRFPAKLNELIDKKYLESPEMLRCPDEVRPNGSYAEYYIPRAPREAAKMGEVPLLVCPLHEEHNHGMQAYRGRYTKQFMVAQARLTAANNVKIERPDGKGPMAATQNLTLRGGDILDVTGNATIQFADGSTCELSGGSKMTVLQSYIEGGGGGAPLYTIVKQTLGKVRYRVTSGSKFDVVTPAATAGVRGTEFDVDVRSEQDVEFLLISDSPDDLFISTPTKTVVAVRNDPVKVLGGLLSGGKNLLDSLLGGLL